jgi:hypothetical protein
MFKEYNKSIRLLVEHLSAPRNTNLDLALITCGLFVCLELLRGDYDRSLNHIEAGLNILARAGPATMSQSTGDSQTVYNELREMFCLFNIDLDSFERKPKLLPSFRDPKTIQMPAKFKDISDARRSLSAIMNYCVTLTCYSGPVESFTSNGSPQDDAWEKVIAQLPTLKGTYDAWNDAFERLLQTQEGASADRRAVLSLEIDYLLAITWTFGKTHRKKTEWDQSNGHFATIVALAEELLLLDVSTEPHFSLNSCALRALQWVASICRLPLVRRKAIQLLSAHPRQEGLWNGRRAAKIGEAIMNLEETRLSSLPVEQRVPPEEDRILYYWLEDFEATKKSHLHVTNGDGSCSILYLDWA